MCNTTQTTKKIKRGDRLLPELLDLTVGSSVEVPYKFYSEPSIRSYVSQLKRQGYIFKVSTIKGGVGVTITRTE